MWRSKEISSNVKYPHVAEMRTGKWYSRRRRKRYERFGETIRFLSFEELRRIFDVIENSRDKMLLRLCYETGCRVGELVRIRLQDLDFLNRSVFIPAEHCKTNQKRTSFISADLMNDIKEYLRRTGQMTKRTGHVRNPLGWLLCSRTLRGRHLSRNRARQIFLQYIKKANLDQIYGKDGKGRSLHRLTIHSLRHSHIMHSIQRKVPVPIIQRQVGHRTFQATMVYCRPNDQMVKEEYEKSRDTERYQ